MTRRNLFVGKSFHAKFARLVYKWFISRKWVTYADIMAEHMSENNLRYSISTCDNYGELKKAFRDVRNAIKLKIGDDCIEEQGNNRTKKYRYIGADDDPLADLRNANAINDLKQYWEFCQDSAGFFPQVWLEYFFDDTIDLLKINRRKQSGEQMISSSLDRELKNIHTLPVLYEAIRDKQILIVDYKPYEEDLVTLIFHPHLLKEHNGRWFLFGHANGKEPEFGYNLALDRIEKIDEMKSPEQTYVQAPKGFYTEYFKKIVGVSHIPGMEAKDITIRATSLSIFNLVETKKIHNTQNTIKPFGKYEDGEYGEFKLNVEPNNEFFGRILQMGEGLEITAPTEIRDIVKQKISAMHRLYEK